MRATDDDLSWLEGGDAGDEMDTSGKGVVVSKSRLSAVLGPSIKSIDRWIREGAPVISRGTTRQGWRINTAAFFEWVRAYDVKMATGDDDHLSFEKAKAREKEAQARLKEDELQVRRGKLVSLDDVVAGYRDEVETLKARLLLIPLQATSDPDVQQAVRAEIIDALADLSNSARLGRDDAPSEEEFEDLEPAIER